MFQYVAFHCFHRVIQQQESKNINKLMNFSRSNKFHLLSVAPACYVHFCQESVCRFTAVSQKTNSQGTEGACALQLRQPYKAKAWVLVEVWHQGVTDPELSI